MAEDDAGCRVPSSFSHRPSAARQCVQRLDENLFPGFGDFDGGVASPHGVACASQVQGPRTLLRRRIVLPGADDTLGFHTELARGTSISWSRIGAPDALPD